MEKRPSVGHHEFIRLCEQIRESLSEIEYHPPEGSNVSVKSLLLSLLPEQSSSLISEIFKEESRRAIRDFCLCCAALASAKVAKGNLFSWIPSELSDAAERAFGEISKAVFWSLDGKKSCKRIGETLVDFSSFLDERKLVIELMPELLHLLKRTIKESSIETGDDADEISASSARVPVAYAIVAAYQFRWFVTQVDYPQLGKICSLVIPCALTALDHWSPEVKGQGMVSFIHLAKNVNATEISWYEDVVLDISLRNIASSDELWHHVVEMSVLLLTCIQRKNPRSLWFEKILTEMLSHLERQPRNKERRIVWLELIDPVFNGMGLVLLAHFRRIFPLFFQWMHVDDDETLILVLERLHTLMKLTWIRNTPYVERLVDELALTYKEAALRRAREVIREHILQILVLLQRCKGPQFERAWEKHRDDPNLNTLHSSFGSSINTEMVNIPSLLAG